MFARVTEVEIDTDAVSVDDVLNRFQAAVVPSLQEQPGYQGLCVLGGEDGVALLVTFWASEASARAIEEGGWYFEVLRDFVTLLRTAPGRATYEVLAADLTRVTGWPSAPRTPG